MHMGRRIGGDAFDIGDTANIRLHQHIARHRLDRRQHLILGVGRHTNLATTAKNSRHLAVFLRNRNHLKPGHRFPLNHQLLRTSEGGNEGDHEGAIVVMADNELRLSSHDLDSHRGRVAPNHRRMTHQIQDHLARDGVRSTAAVIGVVVPIHLDLLANLPIAIGQIAKGLRIFEQSLECYRSTTTPLSLRILLLFARLDRHLIIGFKLNRPSYPLRFLLCFRRRGRFERLQGHKLKLPLRLGLHHLRTQHHLRQFAHLAYCGGQLHEDLILPIQLPQ